MVVGRNKFAANPHLKIEMWAPRLVFVQIEKKQILRCAQDDSVGKAI